MELSPLSHSNTHQIGRQLEELDREIHDCLQNVRKNLKALEEANSGKTERPNDFSDTLKEALKRSDKK